MTREALERAVDALAAEHEGGAFTAAVAELAETLGEADRAVLGEVLLERARRAGVFDQAWKERVFAKGWLRRRLDAADERARAHRRGAADDDPRRESADS